MVTFGIDMSLLLFQYFPGVRRRESEKLEEIKSFKSPVCVLSCSVKSLETHVRKRKYGEKKGNSTTS